MRRDELLMATVGGVLLATTLSARQTDRPLLAGRWQLNGDLSTAPGGLATPPDNGGDDRRPPGGVTGGSGRGGSRPGGFGGRGRGSGGGELGERPSAEDMERRRALLQEVLTLPLRFTLAQKDDTLTIIEPDGVVRSYVANGQSEKHQMTSDVVTTKTRWKGAGLDMEIALGRVTVRRTFTVSPGTPRRLDVVTTIDGGPRDNRQRTVYDAIDE